MASLFLRIGADITAFQKGLERASKDLRNFGRDLERTGTALTKVFTLPLAAAGGSLALLAKSTANAGEELLKISNITGVSVEKLSALKLAADQSETSFEDLTQGFKFLSRNMVEASQGSGEAKEGFDALGISVTDSKGKLKTNEQVMLEVADAFSGMENGARKSAISMQIFGRSGIEMVNFMNQGSQGIKVLTDDALKLGGTMSTSLAKAGDDFNDSLSRLHFAATGLRNRIAEHLLPVMTRLVMAFTNVAANSPVIQGVLNGMNEMIDAFGRLPVSTQAFILGIITLTAALGPATLAIGFMLKALTGLTPILMGLTGPVGIAVAALTALGVAGLLAAERLAEIKAPSGLEGLMHEAKRLREESDISMKAYFASQKQGESTFTALKVSVRDMGDVGERAFKKIQTPPEAIRTLQQYNAQIDKLAKSFAQFQEETTTLQTFDPNTAGSLPEYLKVSSEKMDEVKKKFGEGFNDINQFAIQAARNMQTAFSDLFFNVMTGKLDSFREVLHGFFSSMLRAISEIMAKMLLTKLMDASLMGGLLSSVVPFAEGGIIPGGIRLVPKFQTGGLITSPTLGVVGEGGQPEIISPVDKFFNFLERRDTGDRAKSVTVNQIFNISPGVPEAVRREVMAMRPLLKKDAIEAVQEARNRGGSMARSMGSKA